LEYNYKTVTIVKFQRIDLFFSIFCVILAILAIYLEYYPENAVFFILPTYQALITSFAMGLGLIFVFCFVGNIIPFPTPYILIVWLVIDTFTNGSLEIPILAALVASIGCLLGELISYGVGRGTQRILSGEKQTQIQTLAKIMMIRPSFIPLLIYGFAATPLSDDIILIPLGILKYSPRRTLFFCWLGKLTFMLFIAFIPEIFGTLGLEYTFLTTMVPIFLIGLILYLLLRLDWVKIILSSPLLIRLFGIDPDHL
jgi:membrane protein YqaA with SNARE-associated domain